MPWKTSHSARDLPRNSGIQPSYQRQDFQGLNIVIGRNRRVSSADGRQCNSNRGIRRPLRESKLNTFHHKKYGKEVRQCNNRDGAFSIQRAIRALLSFLSGVFCCRVHEGTTDSTTKLRFHLTPAETAGVSSDDEDVSDSSDEAYFIAESDLDDWSDCKLQCDSNSTSSFESAIQKTDSITSKDAAVEFEVTETNQASNQILENDNKTMHQQGLASTLIDLPNEPPKHVNLEQMLPTILPRSQPENLEMHLTAGSRKIAAEILSVTISKKNIEYGKLLTTASDFDGENVSKRSTNAVSEPPKEHLTFAKVEAHPDILPGSMILDKTLETTTAYSNAAAHARDRDILTETHSEKKIVDHPVFVGVNSHKLPGQPDNDMKITNSDVLDKEDVVQNAICQNPVKNLTTEVARILIDIASDVLTSELKNKLESIQIGEMHNKTTRQDGDALQSPKTSSERSSIEESRTSENKSTGQDKMFQTSEDLKESLDIEESKISDIETPGQEKTLETSKDLKRSLYLEGSKTSVIETPGQNKTLETSKGLKRSLFLEGSKTSDIETPGQGKMLETSKDLKRSLFLEGGKISDNETTGQDKLLQTSKDSKKSLSIEGSKTSDNDITGRDKVMLQTSKDSKESLTIEGSKTSDIETPGQDKMLETSKDLKRSLFLEGSKTSDNETTGQDEVLETSKDLKRSLFIEGSKTSDSGTTGQAKVRFQTSQDLKTSLSMEGSKTSDNETLGQDKMLEPSKDLKRSLSIEGSKTSDIETPGQHKVMLRFSKDSKESLPIEESETSDKKTTGQDKVTLQSSKTPKNSPTHEDKTSYNAPSDKNREHFEKQYVKPDELNQQQTLLDKGKIITQNQLTTSSVMAAANINQQTCGEIESNTSCDSTQKQSLTLTSSDPASNCSNGHGAKQYCKLHPSVSNYHIKQLVPDSMSDSSSDTDVVTAVETSRHSMSLRSIAGSSEDVVTSDSDECSTSGSLYQRELRQRIFPYPERRTSPLSVTLDGAAARQDQTIICTGKTKFEYQEITRQVKDSKKKLSFESLVDTSDQDLNNEIVQDSESIVSEVLSDYVPPKPNRNCEFYDFGLPIEFHDAIKSSRMQFYLSCHFPQHYASYASRTGRSTSELHKICDEGCQELEDLKRQVEMQRERPEKDKDETRVEGLVNKFDIKERIVVTVLAKRQTEILKKRKIVENLVEKVTKQKLEMEDLMKEKFGKIEKKIIKKEQKAEKQMAKKLEIIQKRELKKNKKIEKKLDKTEREKMKMTHKTMEKIDKLQRKKSEKENRVREQIAIEIQKGKVKYAGKGKEMRKKLNEVKKERMKKRKTIQKAYAKKLLKVSETTIEIKMGIENKCRQMDDKQMKLATKMEEKLEKLEKKKMKEKSKAEKEIEKEQKKLDKKIEEIDAVTKWRLSRTDKKQMKNEQRMLKKVVKEIMGFIKKLEKANKTDKKRPDVMACPRDTDTSCSVFQKPLSRVEFEEAMDKILITSAGKKCHGIGCDHTGRNGKKESQMKVQQKCNKPDIQHDKEPSSAPVNGLNMKTLQYVKDDMNRDLEHFISDSILV